MRSSRVVLGLLPTIELLVVERSQSSHADRRGNQPACTPACLAADSIQSLFAAQYIISRREPDWEARARSILTFVEQVRCQSYRLRWHVLTRLCWQLKPEPPLGATNQDD